MVSVGAKIKNPGTESDKINPNWSAKNKIVAGILGILLGGLGIHCFYMGKIGMEILFLLFSWTGILSIIGLIQGIIYLTQDDKTFALKNHVNVQK